jgi:bifunctional non-homologous end joining protein LigD
MSARVDVAGVSLSSPDRVVYPEQGVTKRQLAEYYVRVASRLLPHVAGRPLSLVRCPQGQGGTCFYQKHWTTTLPRGVRLVHVEEESGTRAPYVSVHDVGGLVALVQYGVLELHCWGAHDDDLEHPDLVVFDLDPAPEVPWPRVVHTARALRALLKACGLRSWVKTTGGKGLHVLFPIARDITWDDLHDFVRLTTSRLVADDPEGLVDVAAKAARTNRIFVDYLRNGRGATAVAPWSSRARPGAPVSVPVSWTSLDAITASGVTVENAGAWLRAHRRDPWSDMRAPHQRITQEVMERLLTVETPPRSAPRVSSTRRTPSSVQPRRGEGGR